MKIDIFSFHLFLHTHTFYPLLQNQSRPCTSIFLKQNWMILVVLSTVKIYFVYFGQKNGGNSLLKVALGVALEVLLNIYNHTWGHGCQGSWCNRCWSRSSWQMSYSIHWCLGSYIGVQGSVTHLDTLLHSVCSISVSTTSLFCVYMRTGHSAPLQSGWKCKCINFFPSYLSQGLLVMQIFHAVVIEIWKWFKNLYSIAWCLNPLLKFLPYLLIIFSFSIFFPVYFL